MRLPVDLGPVSSVPAPPPSSSSSSTSSSSSPPSPPSPPAVAARRRRFPGLSLLRRLYQRVRLDDAERSEEARRAARARHGLYLGGIFGPADEMAGLSPWSRGDDDLIR